MAVSGVGNRAGAKEHGKGGDKGKHRGDAR
jgi:hypothetical protein